MRMQYRLFLSLLFLAPFLLCESGEAQDKSSSAGQGARWSDPATWPDGKVPGKGDAVTIGPDKSVVLDVSPPALRSLTIEGKLSFSNDADLELISEWIYLHKGELDIGSEANPHTRNATITLTDNVPDENIDGMGDRGIMLMGGTLSLHGDRKNTWTKLAKTAEAGGDKIEVLNASGWRKGDVIVLASTDFDSTQAEKRTIAAIHGNEITLDQKLKYMHFGKITFGVDERGEVGLLTRNIRIQASDDAESSYFGGHIMAMIGSKMYVSGVELSRMGQHMHLARYPIHWHLAGEGQGQYIENSSIHDTYSRCVTVHGTNNVRVENNVAYNTVGHCYFLEDAVETGNQFIHNLGMMTKCHPVDPCKPTDAFHGSGAGQQGPDILIPSDNTAATFWITNPDNTFRGNVAAGSEATGFWIALPEHPTGAFEGTTISAKTWPRRMPLREFSGNVGHSNFDALMFDRGPSPKGNFNLGGNTHMAYADPSDTNSKRLDTVIDNFTAYKNKNAAIWARGEQHIFKDMKLADNGIGYTHAFPGISPGGGAFTSRVIDSLFVGETENKGNPTRPAEIAYGRSQPNENTDYPIRGYEYYDFGQQLVNTTFVNFEDNATRKTGAISYLMFSQFPISTNNSVEHLTFKNAKPVYFPAMERRWAFEIGNSIGYTGAVILDKDGSLGGAPGSHVVIDNGIADDSQACKFKPTWNAAICKGDYGRLQISPGNGGPGGGFGPGGPAARPAAAGGATVALNTPPAPRAAGAPAAPMAGAPPAPAAAGGPPAGFTPPPAAPPLTLVRNGKEFVTGTGGFFGGGNANTTIRSGTEVKVESKSSTLTLGLTEMDNGSWVIFELPGFATAAAGAKQASLDALRAAKDTAYYSDDATHTLWVKLVVAPPPSTGDNGAAGGGPRFPGFGGGTRIQVSKPS
jgi:cell migration-inducing and hyaluronan-binding protein